jgi:transcriptional antiterminator NusG
VPELEHQWYIINALSGFEKKVAQAITEQAEKKGLSELINRIVIPVEGIVEVKKGQKVNTERKILPGYILIKMVMNDATWHLVKNIAKVSGFLGAGSKPKVVSEKEVAHIFKQIEEGAVASKHIMNFHVGETVKVIDGPFESFVGTVEEVDLDKSRLKVAVSIFGRSTPVELEFSQVAKI